ncbi:NmrA family NAD(P)-binding protein [Lentzea flaviverrucosa]|uniref:NAD(P)H dehydrogenase (Quinone) n=1 Tax=Lentzea flaviverrucosa TaxID=200379 RepID=A0A1H9M1P2_9PSEU|nr:NmrA family NAD(P)-binding protein [Lentzea flaviverrucosa]RDI31107.1 NAD(P)H dehydrogenase (quinone) [Lentzea flaviverrucosa]SER17600.1 NAD(P)H dehydrogenase (quinone) [Lentzea flaviverrucosa]
MTILITGASGQLGNAVVRYVLDRTNEQVVVSVRSPEKFTLEGVEVRQGDFEQPETLDFRGADKLLIVSGEAPDTETRVQQHRNAVAKAVEHGVGHIFYTSLTDADTSTVGVAAVHKATEEAIRATGIPFTFLRNGMYHENYLGVLAGETVAVSTKDGRVASAARDDYALAAAVALTTGGHENQVYELTGSTSWSFPELAGDRYRDVSDDDLVAAGVPAIFVDFFKAIREGVFAEVRPDLEKLIGRPSRPIAV